MQELCTAFRKIQQMIFDCAHLSLLKSPLAGAGWLDAVRQYEHHHYINHWCAYYHTNRYFHVVTHVYYSLKSPLAGAG